MLKINSLFLIIFTLVIISPGIYAEATPEDSTPGGSDGVIPDWLKYSAKWWSDGNIDDQTFFNSIEYLLDNEIITTVSPDMQKPPIYRLPDDGEKDGDIIAQPPIYRLPDDGEKDGDIIAQPPIYKIPPGEDGGFEILLKEIDRLSGDNLQLKIDNQKLVDENLLLNKIIVDLEKKILELNQIIDEQIKRIDNLISSP